MVLESVSVVKVCITKKPITNFWGICSIEAKPLTGYIEGDLYRKGLDEDWFRLFGFSVAKGGH
jgi:hypothetical protein